MNYNPYNLQKTEWKKPAPDDVNLVEVNISITVKAKDLC